MSHETVSIIVPVYNAEKYLDRCVQSLLNQTYPSIEVILVDDGSTDNSLLICERYADEYPNVKSFHTENQGPSSARNFGIEQATGEYIQFADSDDYLELDMVEKMVEAKKSSHADFVMCGYFEESEKKVEIVQLEDGIYTFSEFLKATDDLQFTPLIGSQCNKIFDRECIKRYNLKFENNMIYAEDYNFCVIYMKFCETFCILSDPFYHYRIDTVGSLSKIQLNDLTEIWKSQMLIFNNVLELLEVNNNDYMKSDTAQELFSYFSTLVFYRKMVSQGIFHGMIWARKTIHTSPYRLLIKKTKKIPRARRLNYVFYLLKLIV